MTQIELNEALENHQRWLKGNPDGKRADLTGADLTGAYLTGADLTGADLTGAYLTGAYLTGAYLTGAYLRGADLTGAYLTGAYLRGAYLTGAYLTEADLRGAYLRGADLTEAYLRGADLTGADLAGAKGLYVPYACPETGSFIGYKKAYFDGGIPVIVELEILADAKRCSATSRKCRCNKAKVLSITSLDKFDTYTSAKSGRDRNFIYEVGQIVEVENFNDDRWEECSAGIHFFINRREAVEY